MDVERTSGTRTHYEPHPTVFINADHRARIEALAKGGMERNPALATIWCAV